MTKFFTNSFKAHLIDVLMNNTTEYYMFIGNHLPYADDSLPPTIHQNDFEMNINVYDQMIAAKRIKPSDMSLVVPRVEWTAGTVYTQYENDAAPSLYGQPFYVAVNVGSSYDVFKCLHNAGGLPSTAVPNIYDASESGIIETSDGYVWKYAYNIPESTFKKFATVDYMPVYNDPSVVAVNGSIDIVRVTYPGSGYDCYANGLIQSSAVGSNGQIYWIEPSASANVDFYTGCAFKIVTGPGAGQQRQIAGYRVNGMTRTVILDEPFDTLPSTNSVYEITPAVVVTGSGTGFQGRALINAVSNSVYGVEITQNGTGYRYANATIVGNTSIASNTATIKPVIGPPGGHSSNNAYEFGAKHVCISTTFNSADVTANNKLHDVNDFRIFGVIDGPLFANIHINYTGANGTFSDGELVIQNGTNASGRVVSSNSTVIRLTNATGNFLPGYDGVRNIVGQTSDVYATVINTNNNGSNPLTEGVEYFSQLTNISITNPSTSFIEDEAILDHDGSVVGYAYTSNTTNILTTSSRSMGALVVGSESGAEAAVDTVQAGDIVPGTGGIIFIENNSPINKVSGQTETIKAIIEF